MSDANAKPSVGLRAYVFAFRAIMMGAVAATVVTAVVLIVHGVIETYALIRHLVHGEIAHELLLFSVIQIIETFLLATVAQVVSIGIYQLFINEDVPLPAWLKIHDIDGLKAKLISVVITVLGVFFLGKALSWTAGEEILALGVSVAAVIVALAVFLNVHFRHESSSQDGNASVPVAPAVDRSVVRDKAP
jgi:uncharacterized membrane protein YqhA